MNKSKKLFARALYVVFALALVVGLGVVPAVVSAAESEVWVDDDWTDADNDGGHNWGTDAFDTISGGISAVAVDGTVNVLPGTYNDAGENPLPVVVSVAGVTLQSTGTAAETIIDCDAADNGITITADDVTVDGFTVLDALNGGYAIEVNGDDAIVINNIMTAAAGWPEGIAVRSGSDRVIVSGNELDSRNTMMLFNVSDCTLSNNTFDAGINVQANVDPVSGITITGNDIIGSGATGIIFQSIFNPLDDVLIEDNTISQIEVGNGFDPTHYDAAISFGPVTSTIDTLRITGNDIIDNEGVGIGIDDDATWGTGNTINNNNISGNVVKGIENLSTDNVDAENNWWGAASGPYQPTTNTGGIGDEVSGDVDYRPWLLSPYLVATDLELDADYYHIGGTVGVTVDAAGANTNPIKTDEVTGTAVSTYDIVGIDLTLEETGVDTGIFDGSFTIVAEPGADELGVEDGNIITVTFGGKNGIADVDDTEPTIDGLDPADDATTEETRPTISADYTDDPDVSGIDDTSAQMLVDGVDVTDDATATDSGVTYTPEDDLADGSHDVTVNVSDLAGNEATESWSFRVVSWLVDPESVADDDELDALDTVGVAVSITGDTGDISVGRYASNPEPDAALTFSLIENGFFDVQVTGATDATQIVIKFADPEITAESTAHVWDDLQGMWLACSDQGYNPTDEFLWVKVRHDTTPNIAELTGTPFAISGEAAGIKGDFDVDGDIDIIDFVQFATAYGSVSGDANYDAIGDFDDDGDIDLIDFVQFASVYGTS